MLMKWISKLVTYILLLLFLLTLFMVVSSRINGGIPQVFGYQMMNVLSGSMEPDIHTGSVVLIKPGNDPAKYEKGDIITFRSAEENKIITHRIMEVNTLQGSVSYTTKGDANDGADHEPVTPSNVIGEYQGFTIPLIGYLFAFIKSKAGIAAFLIVPGALIMLWQMVSIWRLISKMETKVQPAAPAEDGISKA